MRKWKIFRITSYLYKLIFSSSCVQISNEANNSKSWIYFFLCISVNDFTSIKLVTNLVDKINETINASLRSSQALEILFI